MAFVGSYLWRLRQRVGGQTVLMPGAMVLVEDAAGRVLLTRRADNGTWCLPAGGAEEGGSFARTALDELREETGLVAQPADLIPFGTLSEAALHTITYPNGDVTHCFAVLFAVRRWQGTPGLSDETVDVAFFDPADRPAPMHPAAATAIDLYAAFQASGAFQAR